MQKVQKMQAMVKEYKYTLQRYAGRRTRHACPQCRQAVQFTRYADAEGRELAPHVGKCNRENNCGYHYTPGQFFRDHPRLEGGEAWKQSEAWKTAYTPPTAEVPPPAYLSREVMERTLTAYEKNNFVRYLASLFGEEQALSLARRFCLGTSKKWKEEAGGLSVIFWQIDRAGNIRQAKAMAYNSQTGRRLKAEGKSFVAFIGKQIAGPDANLAQCFFGEHQLPQFPSAPVAIVESEKTAVIMSALMPDAVWLATGGKNGARWTDRAVYNALEGRTVILYPDLGAFSEWQERGKVLATVCNVSASDIVECNAAPEDRQAGFDLADYFTGPQAPGSPQEASLALPATAQGSGETPAQAAQRAWERWAFLLARYHIARHRMGKAAKAQAEALQWPILQSLPAGYAPRAGGGGNL